MKKKYNILAMIVLFFCVNIVVANDEELLSVDDIEKFLNLQYPEDVHNFWIKTSLNNQKTLLLQLLDRYKDEIIFEIRKNPFNLAEYKFRVVRNIIPNWYLNSSLENDIKINSKIDSFLKEAFSKKQQDDLNYLINNIPMYVEVLGEYFIEHDVRSLNILRLVGEDIFLLLKGLLKTKKSEKLSKILSDNQEFKDEFLKILNKKTSDWIFLHGFA